MRKQRSGRATGTAAQVRAADRRLRTVRILAVVFGGTWVVALLAGALGATGVGALLAAQGKLVFLVGVALMFAVRGAGATEDRAAWWCFSGAVTSYFAGALAYEAYYRYLPVAPRPPWSDLGSMAFSPPAFA